jgi:hypothetical protein
MNLRSTLASAAVIVSMGTLASSLMAFPGGTPRLVTNMNPQCANCHSSVGTDQLRDQSPEQAANMVFTSRHYGSLERGDERYAKLSAEDRAKLLTAVKAVDANSTVNMAVSSAKVKPGATVTVTVTTKGGAGPVVGVMLTDSDLRFAASPVQVNGFWISGPPVVTGPDGQPQTTFLDGRAKELAKNINYVNITGVQGDADAGTWSSCKVVWTLVAPSRPGTYTISAAYLYGTEKSSPIGRVEGPGGRIGPAGGNGGGSGRIQFAKPITITVG